MTYVQKSLSKREVPIKHKFIRALIVATYENQSSAFIYNIAFKYPVGVDHIVCWKFLTLIYKIFRCGHSEVI